jgi:peptidoglycan/LPS O-acetylase OafA/YrhL
MARSTNRIFGFDGLRAIAFLLVFVSHKIPNFYTGAYGMTGVWIFFVLSGFLITRILARSRENIENGGSTYGRSLIDFYVRRAGRIFPPYYTLLIVITVLAAMGLVDIGLRSAFLSNWFFLSNVYIQTRWWPAALGHLWSLSVEEQYYLIFAPIALAVPRTRLGTLCMIMLIVGTVVDIGAYFYGANFITFSVDSSINFALFAIGGLAGLAVRPLPDWLKSAPAVWINIAIIGIMPFLMTDANDEFLLTDGRPLAILFAILLLQISQDQSSALVRALSWTPLHRLGLISYGAYLYHYPISSGSILSHLGLGAEVTQTPWLTVPMDFALTIIAATLSYRYIEQPIRNWSRRLADGRVEPSRMTRTADGSASLG